MNAHARAEWLFVEAEKLGMDRPSEGMIASAINDAESNVWNEVQAELHDCGFDRAADYLENKRKLKELIDQEP